MGGIGILEHKEKARRLGGGVDTVAAAAAVAAEAIMADRQAPKYGGTNKDAHPSTPLHFFLPLTRANRIGAFLIVGKIDAQFAKHHETGETLPTDLFDKLCAQRTYMAGSTMLRQLYFGQVCNLRWKWRQPLLRRYFLVCVGGGASPS